MATVRRTVTVATGVFAPGHLGELTRYLPFELVDDVLARTRTVQRRLRVLPSRTGVYFVLALALFPGLGYLRVWAKLGAGLTSLAAAERDEAGVRVPSVSEKALRELRRRLGPAPLRALFEIVAGPLGQPRTPGVCFAGLRTVAFDGLNSIKVPDSERNRGWLGKLRIKYAIAGFPTVRLLCLVETGTRGLLGAALGGALGRPGDRDEAHLARRLLGLLGEGMLLLADRAYDAAELLAAVHATGAKLLIRGCSSRKPPVLAHLPDGSYLSDIDGLPVRIIEADLTVRGADGSNVGDHYRLITTLLDPAAFPAAALVRLYHERWEIETAFLALRHTQLGGHVLRSQDRAGVEQEVWAMLTVYQLLRTAMVDAVESCPGLDPDRASFTTALQTARDQLTAAAGIDPDRDPHLARSGRIGVIGQAVLAAMLPPRRPRYSTRRVKCSTNRYRAHDDGRPCLPTTIVSVDIAVHTPPINLEPITRPRRSRPPAPLGPRPPRPATRRDLVTAILLREPRQDWPGQQIAEILGVPKRNMLTQLAEWFRLGFIQRTGTGTYALDIPPPGWQPTENFPTGWPAGAQADPDDEKERGKMQRPQRSEDERSRGATNAVHNPHAPHDTPSPPSWTETATR